MERLSLMLRRAFWHRYERVRPTRGAERYTSRSLSDKHGRVVVTVSRTFLIQLQVRFSCTLGPRELSVLQSLFSSFANIAETNIDASDKENSMFHHRTFSSTLNSFQDSHIQLSYEYLVFLFTF